MENLPKSASLPVATVQAVKRNFISRKYDFDYMYFTESDQVCDNLLILFEYAYTIVILSD
jgi:hypothetical protein